MKIYGRVTVALFVVSHSHSVLELSNSTFEVEGSNVILTCTASGYPPPVTLRWSPLADNSTLVNTVTGTFESNVTSIYTLPLSEFMESSVCTAETSTRSVMAGVNAMLGEFS